MINAAASPAVRKRLARKEGVTRPHSLAEFFGMMTGRGIQVGQARVIFSAEDTVAWLIDAAADLGFVELDAAEVLTALAGAKAFQVVGKRVHDYLHSVAAIKAKADRVLTRDADFTQICSLPVERP